MSMGVASPALGVASSTLGVTSSALGVAVSVVMVPGGDDEVLSETGVGGGCRLWLLGSARSSTRLLSSGPFKSTPDLRGTNVTENKNSQVQWN